MTAPPARQRAWRAVYALVFSVCIAIWLIPIRAPLWLDETISWFTIKEGVASMLARQGWPGVPAYPMFLLLWTRVFGSGEVTMRILSVLAMLGAVYLLYRSARELFEWDVALIAAVVFSLHPNVIYAAIDIRPYPFAALAINLCIYSLVRLRRHRSLWLAGLFGFSAASILYFQFLFAVILPPLALCFLLLETGDRTARWQRTGVALAAFVVGIVPVIPGGWYLFHTSGTHVFSELPGWSYLVQALAQKRMIYPLLAVALLAAVTGRLDLRRRLDRWPLLLCVSLAIVPILILFEVSTRTSIHVFVPRYRLIAAPGAALCWAWVVCRVRSQPLRLLFCVTSVAAASFFHFRAPGASAHDYSWKYAIEEVNRRTSPNQAPVLICSDLPESDARPLPTGVAARDSVLFAPLSYYPLSAPVVPLPRSLNDEAKRDITHFLQSAASRDQRFLAMGFMPSWATLDWLTEAAKPTHAAKQLGTYDNIIVMEYTPQPHIASPR